MAHSADTSTQPSGTARELTDDLHWLMVRVARGLGVAEDEAVRRHGLSLRGYVVLCEVARGPAHSQLAIAQAVVMDKSTLVGVLDELEQAGFVTRRPDPADRRVRIVEATAGGLGALDAATAEVRLVEDRLFAGIASRQSRAFVEVLRELAAGPIAARFDTRPLVRTMSLPKRDGEGDLPPTR